MKECKCEIDKNGYLIMCSPCAEEDKVIAAQWAEITDALKQNSMLWLRSIITKNNI